MTASILPAVAQYYDRPPGYIPYEHLPPQPVPEAPWRRRPWVAPVPAPYPPPPGAYVDDAMTRGEVETMLARRGYTMEAPLRRRGDVFIANVMDRRGTILRLTIDAYDGAIVGRRVVAEVVPDWRDRPTRGVVRPDPGFDDDEDMAPPRAGNRDFDERYAARESAPPVAPRVIPAPPMPKVPHPPMRPPSLGTGNGGGESSPVPPVAEAQPTESHRPAPAGKPATIDIPPPDLPDVPPPSF